MMGSSTKLPVVRKRQQLRQHMHRQPTTLGSRKQALVAAYQAVPQALKLQQRSLQEQTCVMLAGADRHTGLQKLWQMVPELQELSQINPELQKQWQTTSLDGCSAHMTEAAPGELR